MAAQGQADVTIVGAGIVGICCALSLLEKGKKVRLIDKDAPGQGASHGNAGVISPWSCIPQSVPGLWKRLPGWLLNPEGPISISPGYLPKVLPWALRFLKAGNARGLPAISRAMAALNRPNVDIYRRHLAGTGHENLVQDSWYIHIFRDKNAANLEDLTWRLRAEQGAPLELLSGQELREIEPCLSSDYKAAVLIKDQARALAPGRIGAVLAEKTRALGGEFVQANVHRLDPVDQGWSITTGIGEIRSAQVVTAAGAWSMKLLRPLGVDVPLEAERGYHLLFRNPGVALKNSIMEVDAKFVASSMEMGLRSAGTAEFAGLDAPPNYRRARMLIKQTKRMLPDLNTADTEEWMGARPSLPDSLPCIDEISGQPGLFAAFGHGHYGLGMAPMTGRIVADLVTNTTPNLDLTPYSSTRF
ncbi:MAG: NAD(P)/FAD-dependent oxidoreductase [Methyloligellaceae bacterium]